LGALAGCTRAVGRDVERVQRKAGRVPDRRVREQGPTCRDVVETITDYLEDRMSPQVRERFEMHLAICAGCETYMEQMRATIAATGSVAEEAIPERQRTELIDAFRDLFAP
jgi:hypothetical protein